MSEEQAPVAARAVVSLLRERPASSTQGKRCKALALRMPNPSPATEASVQILAPSDRQIPWRRRPASLGVAVARATHVRQPWLLTPESSTTLTATHTGRGSASRARKPQGTSTPLEPRASPASPATPALPPVRHRAGTSPKALSWPITAGPMRAMRFCILSTQHWR